MSYKFALFCIVVEPHICFGYMIMKTMVIGNAHFLAHVVCFYYSFICSVSNANAAKCMQIYCSLMRLDSISSMQPFSTTKLP